MNLNNIIMNVININIKTNIHFLILITLWNLLRWYTMKTVSNINSNYVSNLLCPSGKYGKNCESECKCIKDNNANSDYFSSSFIPDNTCSKYSGQCLNCNFGLFGANCSERCFYLCRDPTCCLFKTKKTALKYLDLPAQDGLIKIKINEIELNIALDLSNGFPLTWFGKDSSSNENCNVNKTISLTSEIKEKDWNFIFKNYTITGDWYEETYSLVINSRNIELSQQKVLVTKDIKCNQNNNNINGVIGLGYYNEWSASLQKAEVIDQNIISFSINDVGNYSIKFGQFFEKQLDNYNYISDCNIAYSDKAWNDDLSFANMSCPTQGWKLSGSTTAFKINDTDIFFSLTEGSSLVLQKEILLDFVKLNYFGKDFSGYKCEEKTNVNNEIQITCDKSISQARIPKFGFVVNKHVYYLSSSDWFVLNGEKSDFIIKFGTKNSITLGREFFKNNYVTLSSEAGMFYVLTDEILFYNGEWSVDYGNSHRLTNMSPEQIGYIFLSLVVMFQFGCFGMYLLIKRRRLKDTQNYIFVD